MKEIIKIRNLSVSFSGVKVLHKLSLGLKQNKITAVIGHSGSGKSTLLSALNGLINLQAEAEVEGDIFLAGKNTQLIPSGDLQRRVGTVFQAPTPFPMSIYKNLTYAPQYYGIKDRKLLQQIVVEKLKIVGLYSEVKEDLNKNAGKLSGGQQQRLCIARALTADPEVLLLDEPCSALDAMNTKIIEDLLVDLKSHYTIVIVTHNLAEAKRIADDCIFLANGRLVESGNFQQMIQAPKNTETGLYLRDLR